MESVWRPGRAASRRRPGHELPTRSRSFTNRGLGRTIRLGDSSQAALYRAGQPLSRPGRSYRYCVTGSAGPGGAAIAVFNPRGRIATIASTEAGDRAGAIAIATGSSARRLSRRAHRVMAGVWEVRKLRGGARYVYGVRAGRVRVVAITAAPELRTPARLRSDLKAAGL